MSLEDGINDMSTTGTVNFNPAHKEAEIITHDLSGTPLFAEFIKVGTAGGGSGI